MNDWVKGALILIAYLGMAPALGLIIRNNRRWQSWVFATMVFMTSWHINKITLMLDSIDWYRGATKGFEFGLLDVCALALLIACPHMQPKPRRFIAPGTLLYLLYCAVSWLSILHAPMPIYVAMAGVRFTKAVLVYLAAFQFFRDEEDLSLLLKTFSFTLVVQMLVVLKMKYINHVYQVNGWFEHQNALAMWAYMIGCTLLAAAIGPASKSDSRWYAAGYAASGVIVQSALSRASLVAFAFATGLVFFFSLTERVTQKRLFFALGTGLFALVGLSFTFKTILFRFQEDRNEQSEELRFMLNSAAKDMLHDYTFGIGWNNFAHVINPPFPYGDVIDDWTRSRGYTVDPDEAKPQPESLYWLLLAENGYPGWVTYFLFLLATGFWCLRGIWTHKQTVYAAFLIGLSVALFTTYIHCNVERVLTQTKNLYTWFIFLGVVARIETWRRIQKRAGKILALPPAETVALPEPSYATC